MITVLAIGERERAQELDSIAARNPSLELLHATGLEDALDRLARNRRIDAVLLLVDADAAREIASTLLEEDPAGPPIFLPAPSGSAEGVLPLDGSTPAELLDSLVRQLRADG
jgi:hypothetical protein